jgi:hypothetical protein
VDALGAVIGEVVERARRAARQSGGVGDRQVAGQAGRSGEAQVAAAQTAGQVAAS